MLFAALAHLVFGLESVEFEACMLWSLVSNPLLVRWGTKQLVFPLVLHFLLGGRQ